MSGEREASLYAVLVKGLTEWANGRHEPDDVDVDDIREASRYVVPLIREHASDWLAAERRAAQAEVVAAVELMLLDRSYLVAATGEHLVEVSELRAVLATFTERSHP